MILIPGTSSTSPGSTQNGTNCEVIDFGWGMAKDGQDFCGDSRKGMLQYGHFYSLLPMHHRGHKNHQKRFSENIKYVRFNLSISVWLIPVLLVK